MNATLTSPEVEAASLIAEAKVQADKWSIGGGHDVTALESTRPGRYAVAIAFMRAEATYVTVRNYNGPAYTFAQYDAAMARVATLRSRANRLESALADLLSV